MWDTGRWHLWCLRYRAKVASFTSTFNLMGSFTSTCQWFVGFVLRVGVGSCCRDADWHISTCRHDSSSSSLFCLVSDCLQRGACRFVLLHALLTACSPPYYFCDFFHSPIDCCRRGNVFAKKYRTISNMLLFATTSLFKVITHAHNDTPWACVCEKTTERGTQFAVAFTGAGIRRKVGNPAVHAALYLSVGSTANVVFSGR